MATAIDSPDFGDIQGLIRFKYQQLPCSCFLFLKFSDPGSAKQWLRGIRPEVPNAEAEPTEQAVHVAFTHSGLTKLGLGDHAVSLFSVPFREGMCRRPGLGDNDVSDPERWCWGGPKNEVDAIVLLYAGDPHGLQAARTLITQGAATPAVVYEVDGWVSGNSALRLKEHFGFTDGIGQPHVAGFGPQQGAGSDAVSNTVAAGEFLLGYGNQLMAISPAGPRVVESSGKRFSLGHNGSYLVVRQLRQYVYGFWSFLDQEGPRKDLEHRGAQLVGRWLNGAPLVKTQDPNDVNLANDDTFTFRDSSGKPIPSCPLGAHIRRANPRDSLDGVGSQSVAVANQHRLLRRGRPYGPALAPSMSPDEYLKCGKEDEVERGLLFLAFNADIERQFEFVQSVWINGRNFVPSHAGEIDPVVGSQAVTGGIFTVAASPVRQRFGAVNPIPRFSTVRGGAYFFMPSLRALRYLAS
jgi:Dyp-type peroxidase family